MLDIAIEVGKRIRAYRVSAKLTQEQLAERAGLHPTYIGQLERGEKNATLDSINKLAVALNVSLSELFDKLPDAQMSYPEMCYGLVVKMPKEKQALIFDMLKAIAELLK